MLAQGPKVAALEEQFAAYCGSKFAVAVNSGTAALHTALYAAGIGPGDEVITTPFNFMATINTIILLGGRPVLVYIEPTTFNIDVSKLEAAVTSKTKAILPVHLYGQIVNYDELKAVAQKHNLIVIEDACQAVGAVYRDKKAGALGDLGCFSFYATKNLMCGEGGMVTTDNPEYANAIRRFRQHGMSKPYEYVSIGLNYRMSDLHAAIALAQLGKVDNFNRIRQQNAAALSQKLKDIPNIVLPVTAPNEKDVYHQYTIRLKPGFPLMRQQLIEELKMRDIGSGIYYRKPLHFFTHVAKLGYKEGDFPGSGTGRQ